MIVKSNGNGQLMFTYFYEIFKKKDEWSRICFYSTKSIKKEPIYKIDSSLINYTQSITAISSY